MAYFPTKILLATDGSRDSELAAEVASDLAVKTDSELHIVHVEPSLGILGLYGVPDAVSYASEAKQEARKLLDEQVKRVEDLGATVSETHLGEGHPDKVIVQTSERIRAGLIVIGSRGFGALQRTLIGSVSSSVVHHAHCPVMVVRHE